MLKTFYIILVLCSIVLNAQTTTTIQGSIKDKDYTAFSIDSAFVVGKDLNNLSEVLFSTYTDQNGSFQASIVSTGVEDVKSIPESFLFSQNYPNPFNPSTKFDVSVSKPGNYTLEIFDVKGSKIISQDYNLNSGGYTFDVSGLGAAGVKFYRLTGEDFSETKKMIQLDGSIQNPELTISQGNSHTNSLSKVNNLDMRIFASKEGYITDSVDVSYVYGSVNTQDFFLSQIPTLDTIHVFTDQTLSPTNTPADNASIIGKNGSSTLFSGLTNSNGEFSTDIIVQYVTNPNNINERKYTPNTITINTSRANTLDDAETFNIDGTDLVWINDIEQTLINKNGTATGNVTDNLLIPINNASVKLYNNDNNSLLGQSSTNSTGNYTLNYTYNGYENDLSDLFTPIDSMKFDFSAANHNPKMIVKNFENPSVTNAVLDKNAYNLNATIKLYNTKGDVITDLDSVKITWPDGSAEMIANNNGNITLNKSLFTLNSDTTATITHNHPEQYLNMIIGTTNNSNKVEWLYQTESPFALNNAKIPLNKINNATTEAYFIPKFVNYGPDNNTQIDMTGSTVTGFLSRGPFGIVSGFRPSPAGYDTTDIVQKLYNETTNEPMPQNQIDRANNEIQKFLTTVNSWSHKKLLNYRFTQIDSSTDPFFLYLTNPSGRNADNLSISTFYNSGPLNIVNISNDGSLRIKYSTSKYNTGNTNNQIQEELFDSMLNTMIDDQQQFILANNTNYTDLAKNLMGISLIMKPGTNYWEQ